MMSDEVIPVRSKNNNVLKRSSYWGNWSRILFHDAGGKGMLNIRKRYSIPDCIGTIEIDLTPINGFCGKWEEQKTNKARIRCHCTSMDTSDVVFGTIPVDVLKHMHEYMSERTVDLLLHADYLPYLDFKKKVGNPATFEDMFMEPVTLDQYWGELRRDGGGPGLLKHDVKPAYDALIADWTKKIKSLTPE